MNKQILELIAIVHDNYEHIQQLETLGNMLKDKYPEEYEVCRTTQNSHYDYKLYTRDFQDHTKHINNQLIIDNEYYHATKRHGKDSRVNEFAWDLYYNEKKLKEQV